jgi:hypothetical protein
MKKNSKSIIKAAAEIRPYKQDAGKDHVTSATAEDFRKILQPVRQAIVDARDETGGIVFVVQNPPASHVEMWRSLGIEAKPGGTAVVGMTCAEALEVFERGDLATRRWLAEAPAWDSIKVFLVTGEGTALLTLRFGETTVWVSWESNAPEN